ncbi:succinate-semialdehyde dehydrogenase [Helicobacter saguini]|uniref:Succinate-semialdehyde dehydrogenase n=1 Tax=Helicobacter saguini TaxID=1548018 RepID=A0A099BAT2_9HELI|nr:NAD-dependent succinate-semialdehyde dehydrogenase [Helicobacter saguini]MWV60971.1 succinate-semialdehyde dehydrogenase [Helicobacter saguini]MWV68360.1 succinate-semialdehyde dehydrogenase [Helicobacter saguini]MWV70175.1 succinate-semialdehyde dehydrogenase [Helicobacter saguini]MWV72078.1 succinate-semialdehyde dehydrogenase [Helicobacter saguini]TLD93701.1 NAD-dependent succinate-semialdehyde dehydrogenase [Helicobacter saguini]
MSLDSTHFELLNHEYVSKSSKDGFIAVTNPATGENIAWVYDIKENELVKIIESSQKAQKKWASLLALERANILLKWYDLMLEHKQKLAEILTIEMGKPITEASGEIVYAANFIRWFAEECRRIDGDILQPVAHNQKLLVLKQPIGVCGAITPWNFPSAMITRKAAPALACGCSMIVKPATQTPLSAYALAVLAYKVGVPRDLLQIVTGKASMISKILCESDIVRKITFTGSTEVGRVLMAQSSSTIKKLSLELGGNAPFIVFDDANIDEAVKGILASKFRNSGQTCVCANRIYIQSGVYDKVAAALKSAVEALKVGNGIESSTTQGPLIDSKAVEKVKEHIADAVGKGAKVLCGGKPHTLGHTFFEPTILTNVTQKMAVAREETFGPLAPLFKFESENEVIEMANDTEFGLAAYLYTKDSGRLWRVGEALEYGIVGVNTGIISTEVAPFGGVKQSGLGREGSKYGIEDYLEIKYMCVNL